jgi:hypothetical protein
MNDSRRRRALIRQKAMRARRLRLLKEIKKEKIKVLPNSNTYRAIVFLKLDNLVDPEISTSVIVDLPQDNPTAKIEEMQKNGFWVPRPIWGMMKYFPSNSISQVQMIVEK